MAKNTLTCPFCNAQFSADASNEARVECPRCGEPYPDGEAPDGKSRARAKREPGAPARKSNRTVVFTIAGIMLAMALIGGAFAWWTISDRRKRDHKERAIEVTAPADLAMLGYLPGDTDIILGLHIAELLENPQGRELLDRVRLPIGDAGLGFIEQWTGVPLQDIDHLVMGFLTDWGGFPRTTILLQLRKPVDGSKTAELLHSTGWKKLENKKYRTAQFPPPGALRIPFRLEGALWMTGDDYRLVLQAPELQLKQIPDTPNPGIGHFTPAIQKGLRARAKGTQLWMVGDVADWNKSSLSLFLTLGAAPERVGKTIRSLRTFNIAVELGQSLQLSTDFEARTAEGASLLEEVFTEWAKAGAIFGSRPETKLLRDELANNLKTDKKETHFSMQTKVSADLLKKALAADEAGQQDAKKEKTP